MILRFRRNAEYDCGMAFIAAQRISKLAVAEIAENDNSLSYEPHPMWFRQLDWWRDQVYKCAIVLILTNRALTRFFIRRANRHIAYQPLWKTDR